MSIWILVADAARARLFSAQKSNSELVEEQDFYHGASRLKGRDLESDAPGRAFDSVGGGRHAMSKEVDFRQEAAEDFAAELSQILEKCRFEKLYIVAAPAFLGKLRQQLDANVSKQIVAEIDKDLVSQEVSEIRAHLPQYL